MFQRFVEGAPTVMFPALAPVEHVVLEQSQQFQPATTQQQQPLSPTYEVRKPDQAEAQREPVLAQSFTELLHSDATIDMVIP